MTKDQFVAKYRGPMLLFLTECWAAHRDPRKGLADLIELQHARARELLGEMFDSLQTKPAAANGPVQPQARK